MTPERISQIFSEMSANFARLPQMGPQVVSAAELISTRLRAGGKVFFCGNGGSAADAQHLAAELVGRFLLEREPLSAWALTVNTSALTAIGNDYSYDDVFSRQLRGLGRPGDVLVGISTSGNSRNIIRAIEAAREMDIVVIGMTGETGGDMAALCDVSLKVPSASTPRIQEMHIAIGHLICELVEADCA